MYRILVASPCGGSISLPSISLILKPTARYEWRWLPSGQSGPNFNACWVQALNLSAKEGWTHLAMHHADIQLAHVDQDKLWVDALVDELDATGASYVSVPIAIKDDRGLTSCGIADPDDPWNPWRRFTLRELESLPKTFHAGLIGYGNRCLLHNNALCLWDLRNPEFHVQDRSGANRFVYNFTERIQWTGEEWFLLRDSEDWAYSKQLWQHHIRTVITRKLGVIHYGQIGFASWGERGRYLHDEDLRTKWQEDGVLLGQPNPEQFHAILPFRRPWVD